MKVKFEHVGFDIVSGVTQLSKIVHSLRKIYSQMVTYFRHLFSRFRESECGRN